MIQSLGKLANPAPWIWGLSFLGASTAILGLVSPTLAQTSVVFGQTGQVVTIPNTFVQPTFVVPPISAYPPLLPFPVQNNQPMIYQANPYNQPVLIYPRSGSTFYGGHNQPIIYQASPHNQPVLIYPPRN
ncbi:hypothetical protein RIF25_12305 [Thermosynechococcaceae cyanobacterium BACA0444]|uniref:Uncharacterized protein n=1 Tax=Pseudocalidococcus azoricus BACA0444 TaxID=2918990 RepID=A0AAE4FSN0_9CYAN|nr:hypothetical protein [Pseudocalidococcus azoricus]MDS3861588.1 hypothetical protein [Pseudocalidococcus azoricus BACA0444]